MLFLELELIDLDDVEFDLDDVEFDLDDMDLLQEVSEVGSIGGVRVG